MTERKLWAKRRNWLIYRLRGIKAVFNQENNLLIHSLMPDEAKEHLLISVINIAINDLIAKILESEWKGK